jgi:hypothetical protein
MSKTNQIAQRILHESIDQQDSIQKRYSELKIKSLKELKDIYGRNFKVHNINSGGPWSKGELITDILRTEFRKKEVDKFFKLNESLIR